MENLLKIKAIFQQLHGITRITYKSTTIIHARNQQIKNNLNLQFLLINTYI